jgi:hypothetical protein
MTVCLNCGDLPIDTDDGAITRAQQLTEVAGILSRIVGSVAALECARNIVAACADGYMPLGAATTACMAHRRTHWRTYGVAWCSVTERQISECASAVACVGQAREEAV